jgi:hypothetical protein
MIQDDVLIFNRRFRGEQAGNAGYDTSLCQIAAWIVVLSNDENARMMTARLHH